MKHQTQPCPDRYLPDLKSIVVKFFSSSDGFSIGGWGAVQLMLSNSCFQNDRQHGLQSLYWKVACFYIGTSTQIVEESTGSKLPCQDSSPMRADFNGTYYPLDLSKQPDELS